MLKCDTQSIILRRTTDGRPYGEKGADGLVRPYAVIGKLNIARHFFGFGFPRLLVRCQSKSTPVGATIGRPRRLVQLFIQMYSHIARNRGL